MFGSTGANALAGGHQLLEPEQGPGVGSSRASDCIAAGMIWNGIIAAAERPQRKARENPSDEAWSAFEARPRTAGQWPQRPETEQDDQRRDGDGSPQATLNDNGVTATM